MGTSVYITIDALDFHDLNGFYKTVYNLMELCEDWAPAHNLDAFNDMLYSGFGKEPVVLEWKRSEKSRIDLGVQATRLFYQQKIDHGKPYNTGWARKQLDDLNSGKGATLFDIIVEIFQSHNYIQLVFS